MRHVSLHDTIDTLDYSSACHRTTAMDCKFLTSPSIADTYSFVVNTWNTLPESYRQKVYKNTLATVKGHIQQAENPTPTTVSHIEAAHFDNAILLDYLTSKVALEEPDIACTDPNILIDNNCTDNKLQIGMPRASTDYEDDGDESHKCDAIPIASWRRLAATIF